MSKMWRITQIADAGDLIWLTMENAPKELLEPNTLHLKTFYPVRPDDARPRPAIINDAIAYLTDRAIQAIAGRQS